MADENTNEMNQENQNSEIWFRQPEDTSKSYAGFCYYRDMGSARSLSKAYRLYAEEFGFDTPYETYPAYFGKWSAENDWVERASAYDAFLRDQHVKKVQEAQMKITENALDDYEEVRKALRKHKFDLRERSYNISLSGIRELLNTLQNADDYARRAAGLPDKITESKNFNDNKHAGSMTLLSEMSDDELDKLLTEQD